MKRKTIAAALVVTAAAASLTACSSDADMASKNLAKSAEMFEVPRRVVFFNGITDKYLLTVEGYCSVETAEGSLAGALEVTCKTGPGQFKKDMLGLSDNVSYFVEQLEPVHVSEYHYRVIFRPEEIVPDINLETSSGGDR